MSGNLPLAFSVIQYATGKYDRAMRGIGSKVGSKIQTEISSPESSVSQKQVGYIIFGIYLISVSHSFSFCCILSFSLLFLHSLKLPFSQVFTHSTSFSYTCTCRLKHTISLTHTHSQKQAFLSLTLSLWLKHTHTLFLSHPIDRPTFQRAPRWYPVTNKFNNKWHGDRERTHRGLSSCYCTVE